MATSEYKRSYNSFSGVDIKATFGGKVVGELQGVSFSVTREKAPIYTMGSADPRSFSRGKRGIAGTLVFTVFDRSALIDVFKSANYGPNGQFYAHDTDIQRKPGANIDRGVTINELSRLDTKDPNGTDIQSDNTWTDAWYSDQLPPFDIVLTAANEYGQIAMMSLRGCEILNEGSGISIDDIVTEQQMTFIARELLPWKAQVSEKQ